MCVNSGSALLKAAVEKEKKERFCGNNTVQPIISRRRRYLRGWAIRSMCAGLVVTALEAEVICDTMQLGSLKGFAWENQGTEVITYPKVQKNL